MGEANFYYFACLKFLVKIYKIQKNVFDKRKNCQGWRREAGRI